MIGLIALTAQKSKVKKALKSPYLKMGNFKAWLYTNNVSHITMAFTDVRLANYSPKRLSRQLPALHSRTRSFKKFTRSVVVRVAQSILTKKPSLLL